MNICVAQTQHQGIGRPATPQEIAAWDIDVRPDFKGLPKGQGSVKQGELLWEAQCASCHGSFGESAEVFTPIAGGIKPGDLKTGRVASLLPGANQPQRTTVMKLSSVSTLWDYINRAMPWNNPKTLKPNEVYALSSYVLHLGDILPADFVLSEANIKDVQALLPNRNGMTTAHAMWPGSKTQRPDVQGSACMKNCGQGVAVTSALPDYAKDAHGNLAEQSRGFGASRGQDTQKIVATANSEAKVPAAQSKPAAAAINNVADPILSTAAATALMQKNACLACHSMDSALVGPSLKAISAKYAGQADAQVYLAGKIRGGSAGVWGAIPMPAQAIGPSDSAALARWLLNPTQ